MRTATMKSITRTRTRTTPCPGGHAAANTGSGRWAMRTPAYWTRTGQIDIDLKHGASDHRHPGHHQRRAQQAAVVRQHFHADNPAQAAVPADPEGGRVRGARG